MIIHKAPIEEIFLMAPAKMEGYELDSTALMEQPNEEAEKEIIYEAEKVEKKATKQDLGMTSKSSTRRW